jgi:hypothetical protein
MNPTKATQRPRRELRALILAVVIALVALVARGLWAGGADQPVVPQSSVMETSLGVRFSRIAVVGDGGLVTLSYVVLDAEKAKRFQSDAAHPPVLRSEARDGSTSRVSLMRQGHTLRPGSTYYLVYQNTAGALRPGEEATIEYAGMSLPHVPVL